jgi:uncharacterized protein (DUF433 family)
MDKRLRHYKYDRIRIDPAKCSGKPCIRELRMPVGSILSYLGSGMTVEDILRSWPELELEDIHQALSFAAMGMDEEIFVPETDAAA